MISKYYTFKRSNRTSLLQGGGLVDKCLLEAGVLDVGEVLDVHDEFVVLLDQAQGDRIEGADMML